MSHPLVRASLFALLACALVVALVRAFRSVHALRPTLPLWNADGIHASAQGYYLAAAVFFAVLLERDPSDVVWDGGLEASEAAYLRRAAWSAARSQRR